MAGAPRRNFFRDRDIVTVHNYIHSERDDKKAKGRIISVNRKTRYNQSIVVLVDIGDTETVECFCTDGSRYLDGSTMTISLGWEANG